MSEVIERPAAPVMTPEVMIEKYLALRDRKDQIKKRQTEELAPYNEMLARLEGWLLEALNQAGLSSMRAPSGTAYKTVRTSAKVQDWPATLAFIRANEVWELLEARVSKLAAEQIIKDLGQAIPGVAMTAELCVNCMKASASSKGK